MRPKIREILEECIANGIELGCVRAKKHTETPSDQNLFDCIDSAIWYQIDERFDFERSLVNEVLEGIHALKDRDT